MKKIFLLIIAIATLYSCNDFLDVEPKGKAIPSTVEDYDLMLGATSFALGNSYYMDPDIHLPSDLISALNPSQLNAFTWAENQYYMTESDNDWNSLYQKLYYCNEIIENIDGAKSENNDENLRKEVKGQAYAQRAHIYFWLVNMYGKHYDATTKDSDLGVPKVVVNDITQQLPRATVGEIYELIESDIKIAKDLVPKTIGSDQNSRASQISINALLSKIELYKGEFDNALNYANLVISAWGENFNDFSSLANDRSTYLDYLPELMYYSNPEFIWFSSSYYCPQLGFNDGLAYLTQDMENLYTEYDLRYHFWTTDTTDAGESLSIDGSRRYVNWYYKSLTASISEIYLIRAECYARSGENSSVSKAMADVNMVRKYRFRSGSDYELTANTLEEALNFIKEERRREFVCTGTTWFDLRRYQAYGDDVPTFTRTVKGKIHTLNPGSNRYLMAIPEYVRSMNPLLIQNPR